MKYSAGPHSLLSVSTGSIWAARSAMTRFLTLVLTSVLIVSLPSTPAAQERSTRTTGTESNLSWDTDPNGGRLFFAPTARITPSRRGAVTLYEMIAPMLTLTMTGDLVLSAGTTLVTEADGSRAWIVSGKFNLPAGRRFEAAVAALTVISGSDIWGMFYGVVTIGDDNRSITGGAGYSYFENSIGNQLSIAEGASLFVGGDLRLGPKLKLVSENHLQPGTDTIISLGVRFIGKKISADLGAGLIRPERDPLLFPIINVAWNW